MQSKKLIPIIYEDAALVIVNKPSGLLTVPAPEIKGKDLVFLINKQVKTKKEAIDILPCHRLDKETSGVIIFAKGKVNQEMIMNQFRKRLVKKIYIAFAQGHLKQGKGVLRGYIQGAWPYRRQEKKKIAITKYRLICRTKDFSVLEISPVTGRTNQIRIQFRDQGNPLIGERRFSFAKDWQIKFKRIALHSFNIQFQHPISGLRLKFTASLPQDMSNFLKEHGVFDQFRKNCCL